MFCSKKTFTLVCLRFEFAAMEMQKKKPQKPSVVEMGVDGGHEMKAVISG